jgi:hypothetical protein
MAGAASAGNELEPAVLSAGEGIYMAASMHGGQDIHEPEDWQLSDELARALKKVVVARDRLQAESPQSPGYQGALTTYLHATVHHLAILAVAQAQQTEQLSAEVAALRARVEALAPVVH